MINSKRVFTTLIIPLMLFLGSSCILAQDTRAFDERTKLIRIKKIANEWQGTVLTLQTRDGEEVRGRLIEVLAGSYHLEVGEIRIQVPLEDVVRVSYQPGTPELLLSFAAAVMGSAFFSGAILIAKDDASPANVNTAALLGMLAGGLWGHTTFYESEVIYIE